MEKREKQKIKDANELCNELHKGFNMCFEKIIIPKTSEEYKEWNEILLNLEEELIKAETFLGISSKEESLNFATTFSRYLMEINNLLILLNQFKKITKKIKEHEKEIFENIRHIIKIRVKSEGCLSKSEIDKILINKIQKHISELEKDYIWVWWLNKIEKTQDEYRERLLGRPKKNKETDFKKNIARIKKEILVIVKLIERFKAESLNVKESE